MKLTISPLAEQDIESIGDYIARDSPQQAIRFTEQLFRQCQLIAQRPEAYRKRPELGENIRSCSYRRYIIIFCVMEEDIRVERLLHGARDIAQVLSGQISSLSGR